MTGSSSTGSSGSMTNTGGGSGNTNSGGTTSTTGGTMGNTTGSTTGGNVKDAGTPVLDAGTPDVQIVRDSGISLIDVIRIGPCGCGCCTTTPVQTPAVSALDTTGTVDTTNGAATPAIICAAPTDLNAVCY
jgi:hypothetical protein